MFLGLARSLLIHCQQHTLLVLRMLETGYR